MILSIFDMAKSFTNLAKITVYTLGICYRIYIRYKDNVVHKKHSSKNHLPLMSMQNKQINIFTHFRFKKLKQLSSGAQKKFKNELFNIK